MLDIHTHLFWDSYDADRDEVIRRARAAGVEKMICVGTSPEDNPQAIAVAEKYDGTFASVGLHPHYFNQLADDKKQATGEIEALRNLSQSSKKIIAIGECGLDYYARGEEQAISGQQKAVQKEGFVAQIALAQDLGLPIIIHTRPSAGTMDAYEEMFEILKAASCNLKAVLHCYQGDSDMMEKFLALPNIFFSFAGNVTYPVKKNLTGTKNDMRETIKNMPLERMMVETDCPFLAPVPYRGTRNEPAYVCATVEYIATVRGETAQRIALCTTQNAQSIFGI